jgi:hypothetical protein
MAKKPDFRKDVFPHAVRVASDLRKKDPSLGVPASTKAAWKTAEIKKLYDDYQKKKAAWDKAHPGKAAAKPKAKAAAKKH